MSCLKKTGKIISNICICFLLVILFFMGTIFIQTLIAPDEVPTILGYKPFIVLSSSMETEIYKGDLVLVKNIDNKDLVKNDIIAFKSKDNYVTTHRIVDIKDVNGEIRYITKGDNNNSVDSGYVNYSSIEGIYAFRIPELGNVLLILKKPITLITIILVISLLGVIVYLSDRNYVSNEEKAQLEKLIEENNRLKQEEEKKKKVRKSTSTKKNTSKKTTTKKKTTSSKKKN